jgi:phosphoribosylformylglycinamidine synthase
MATPSVLVLRAPGTNCDRELAFAFERAGARVASAHVNRLRESPALLRDHQILAVPGGFSYGDDVAAGRILATQLSAFLADALREFRDREKLILGVCNGFQALLKAGLLVQPDDEGPLATLAGNAGGRFVDRWVRVRAVPGNRSLFLKNADTLYLPVAHGEGNFRCREGWIAAGLAQAGQVGLVYADADGTPATDYPHNPNGSQNAIAGVCDASGRVFGLMPHPERHVLPTQHPAWTRHGLAEEGDGLAIFRNAVSVFRD